MKKLLIPILLFCCGVAHAAVENRLKDKPVATVLASDDYIYIDGTTNKVRAFRPTSLAGISSIVNAANLDSIGAIPYGNLLVSTGSYANPAWITSLAWAKLTGIPSYEPVLGNPSVNGYVLSSTVGGTRSWVAQSGGGGSVPTGTGFRHVTTGAEDGTAKLVDTADITDGAVTNLKLALMATKTYKGRTSAGTGAPEDVPVATLKSDLALNNVPNLDTSNAGNIGTGTLGAGRLPLPTASTIGGVMSLTPTASQWIRSIGTDGLPTKSQPAFSDISGTATPAQIPLPTSSTIGGVQSSAAVTNQWINSIGTDGIPIKSQPGFGNLSGSATDGQLPATFGTHTYSGVMTLTDGLVNAGSTVTGVSNTYTLPAANRRNKISFSAAPTLALSGTWTTDGLRSELTAISTSGSTLLVTLPAGTWYDSNGGRVITSYWHGANATETLTITYDAANTRYIIDGVPQPSTTTEFAQTAATTTDLWQSSLNQTVTGVTAITSFGSNAPTGAHVHLRFLAATPITYNATSMIIPGSTTYTASIGDLAEAIHLGSGNWTLKITKRDGTAVVSSGGSSTPTPVTLTDGATIALNASLGRTFRVTLAGARALLAPTSPTDGQVIDIEITQDGTGGRTMTLPSGANGFRFGTDAPSTLYVLSTTAGKTDYLTAKYRTSSTTWDVLSFIRGY